MKGKEKQGSLFLRITIPVILLVFLQGGIFLLFMKSTGLVDELNENRRILFSNQVAARRDYLEDYMTETWGVLDVLSEELSREALRLEREGRIDIESMDQSSEACIPLLEAVYESFIRELRFRKTTGIFVVFNREEPGGDLLSKPGLVLRDRDPEARPSTDNSDLETLISPAGLRTKNRASFAAKWEPQFSLMRGREDQDYFFRVYDCAVQGGYGRDPQNYAYWGMSKLFEDSPYAMTYSLPLILSDGRVYGVIGVSLSYSYIESFLPVEELDEGLQGTYFLARQRRDNESGELSFFGFPSLGRHRGIQELKTGGRRDANIFLQGGWVYTTIKDLSLYQNNAPFEGEGWVLIGMVPTEWLYSFTRQMIYQFFWGLVVAVVCGILASLVIGRGVTGPIRRLSRELRQAQEKGEKIPSLSSTGIKEIDSFKMAIVEFSTRADLASERIRKKIEQERDYDILTGLLNRGGFYRSLEDLFSGRQELRTAAFLMMDLDNLKSINDRFGHEWGDKYISRVAEVFYASLPQKSLCSRISGDEFYIFYYGMEKKEEIEDYIAGLYERIRRTDLTLPDGSSFGISLSGGYALYPEHAEDFRELLRMSDFAMYQVKLSGKGRIEILDPVLYRESLERKKDEEAENML